MYAVCNGGGLEICLFCVQSNPAISISLILISEMVSLYLQHNVDRSLLIVPTCQMLAV